MLKQPAKVTTRSRALNLYDVFVTVGNDDRRHAGVIERDDDGWWAMSLGYRHRSGATLDIARRYLVHDPSCPYDYSELELTA